MLSYDGIMDDRKSIIRELEDRKKADTETRNRLLEGLGETLLLRIGEWEPFLGSSPQAETGGEKPGVILTEFRKHKKDIAESEENIRAIEAAIQRFKELEESISGKTEELSRLEKSLEGVYVKLGKELLAVPGEDTGASRQQEETVLAKIDELEKKLDELQEKEGNIFTWVGKNAQIAVSKALLVKNRSALSKVYRDLGEKFISGHLETHVPSRQESDAELLIPDYESAGEALELRNQLSSLAEDLTELKTERGKLTDQFGTRSSQSRRIQGLEKRILQNKAKLEGVYLRFGFLAAGCESGGALSSLIVEEDKPALERAEVLKNSIEKSELEIERIKAAISIDNEKTEIEKMKKAISGQQQKIAAAREAIADFENQIAESESRIEELEAFLREDHGRESKEGGQNNKEAAAGEKKHTGKGGRSKSKSENESKTG